MPRARRTRRALRRDSRRRGRASPAAPRCRAPPNRDRGPTHCRSRRCAAAPFSRVISFCTGTIATSATALSGTVLPPGTGRRIARIASMLPRDSGVPQTTTSKNRWSSKNSPTFVPCTSVVTARRTSPGVRPRRSARSGRNFTSICGTSTCGCALRSTTPSIGASASRTAAACACSRSRSGPSMRTTIVALAPVSTSLMRSRR